MGARCRAMAETNGPLQLLEVCKQRLSRFLHDAEHKHLVWLREVEEQGMRMLDSNFGAEPELMSKTPSQRRRPKKRQPSCLKEDSKEPSRRRSSRRRSSTKLGLSKPSSQRRLSKLPPQDPSQEAEVPTPSCSVEPQASLAAECPVLTGTQPPEAPVPVVETGPQGAPCEAGTREQVPWGNAAPELPEASPMAAISTAREEESPGTVRTSTPKAAGDAAMLHRHQSPQGLPLQDSNSKATPGRPDPRRCSGHRRSRRASLAGRRSLGSRRKSIIHRSVSRGISRKAAARESSSSSSCQSSVEGVVEDDVTSSTRPRLEPNPPGVEAPDDIPASSRSMQAASPFAQCSVPQHQEGSCAGLSSEPQKESQEPPHCAKPQENPPHTWTRTCRQAVGALWSRPQRHVLSPLDDKQKSSANQTPSSSSPASKVVRPLKNFLQAVQHNQLLASPGPSGQGGGIKSFIRRNTPTRPNVKGDFVERERQRLESLRKKQEAEEQRRKKVEEEKRRRQAEMRQKREERLRKALQAKERVEQMEEEKKRRMEQKILQSDEKVRPSHLRDEKVAEERSKKKVSKKLEEADARKQKAPRREENDLEKQEPLQKREDEVKGKKVWELRSLVEQRQVEYMKERDHKQRWREKVLQVQLEPVGFAEKNKKEEESPKLLQQLPGQEKRDKPAELAAVASNPWLRAAAKEDALQEPQQLGKEKKIKEAEALPAACDTWLSKAMKKSFSSSCLGSSKVDANNYGMDLNSDDSTDDESEPRKPVPAWAEGSQLNQAVVHQYYHPVDVDEIFGLILSPKLEDIFGKSKPRYFKRTSSAVWNSPPGVQPTCSFKP
ncbi:inner centromere protein-like isoform X2 [Pogoniulus pusillus]|uniref:inner centromere protein-like isoform X2 n=1 Tax=Pogoniulus pusillus TaxID=488313 RepID=UPI0030B967C1